MNEGFVRRFVNRFAAAWIGLAVFLSSSMSLAVETPPLVFAAASLQPTLIKIGEAWRSKTGNDVAFSFAGSAALARQIENGAPADIFISADPQWMDWAQTHDAIRQDTRRNLLGNGLVLIAAPDVKTKLKIEPNFSLVAAIGDSRLATGDPKSVTVGIYAKESLTALGVWTQVEPLIAGTDNVRAALTMVVRGEAKFGIVYRTDAQNEPKVRLIDVFPENTHAPIIYPAAVTTRSASDKSAAFFAFLFSPDAARIFEKEGFTILK